jgi:hypothetical protein
MSMRRGQRRWVNTHTARGRRAAVLVAILLTLLVIAAFVWLPAAEGTSSPTGVVAFGSPLAWAIDSG